MNRIDLQQLARTRLREAAALLNAGEWSGAYYLAGYAVECGLKACIARMTNQHDFPDKDRVLRSYSHSYESLLVAAELTKQRDHDVNLNLALSRNWSIVRLWSEASRYTQASEPQARELFAAISHPVDGVLAWCTGHW